jgi:hypothetical protein
MGHIFSGLIVASIIWLLYDAIKTEVTPPDVDEDDDTTRFWHDNSNPN